MRGSCENGLLSILKVAGSLRSLPHPISTVVEIDLSRAGEVTKHYFVFTFAFESIGATALMTNCLPRTGIIG